PCCRSGRRPRPWCSPPLRLSRRRSRCRTRAARTPSRPRPATRLWCARVFRSGRIHPVASVTNLTRIDILCSIYTRHHAITAKPKETAVRKRDLRDGLPPGPRVPAAMQLLATWTRPAASLERMRRRYGPRITVRLPFQPPFVLLSDPAEIKEL